MSRAVAHLNQPTLEFVRPSDSARTPARIGWLVILVFLGGGGFWTATAPLNAAVVGDAVIKVDGNRKSIEHVDGGTVKEVLVHEGDHVKAGDVVVVLDDTYARTAVQTLSQQQAQFLATEARLRAEFMGAGQIDFPITLLEAPDGVSAAAAMQDQQHEFASRREALVGKKAVLTQRIAQYTSQIDGYKAQIPQLDDQLASITAERDSLKDLLKKGLTTRTRMLELDRQESTILGQKAEIQSNINATNDAIAGLHAQSAQLDTDQIAQVTADLRDITTKLADITPKLEAARVVLERTQVRSPYSGKVVDLKVFSTGAVIGRGDKILDIVPDDTSLGVEAKIRVEDISDVAPGMTAEVHFTSYKQRTTPIIHGLVSEVSADRLTDERTQIPYYVAKIDVTKAELAASPEIQLYPGMPATVMITTKERTALDYIVGPLLVSFDKSFREK